MPRKSESHLDRETLLRAAERGELSPGSRTHAERCPSCRERYEDVRSLVTAMREERAPEPPAAVVARAERLFERRPSLGRRIVETAARLLRGPELPGLAAAHAVRSETGSPARLRFAGEGLEVDVELARERTGLRLMAQVLGLEGATLPSLVWAEKGGKLLCEAPVAEHGLFGLDALPPGGCDIVLDLGERRLRLHLQDPMPSGKR